MASKEHLTIIKAGVDAWNGWRKDNPNVVPNLSGADLGAVLDGPSKPIAFTVNQFDIDVVIRGADLRGCDFSGADLRDASLHNTNLARADFRGANLERAKITSAALVHADFSEAKLVNADFSHSNLAWTNLSEANLMGACLRGVIFDEETQLKGAKVDRCKIDRYALESLQDYGGLTNGARMLMDIHDDVADLRASFSGVRRWLHLIALGAFLFPYLWFAGLRYSEARFIGQSEAETLPLWQALARYIWNGGQNWQTGWDFHWSFVTFVALAIYNALRWLLLSKTNRLEHRQEISGLPVRFNLDYEPFWSVLVRCMSFFTWIAVIILALNTAHFLAQEIPIVAQR